MADVNNDKFTETRGANNGAVTTVSSGRSPGGASLSCDALTDWPQATVHFITYQKTADNKIDKTTQQDFKGIVSGNTIGSVTLKQSPTGSDVGNIIGEFVQLAPTGAWADDLYDGLTATLKQDGTLKAGILKAADYGAGSIPTAAIADGAVTPIKLSLDNLPKIYTATSDITFNPGNANEYYVPGWELAYTVPLGVTKILITTSWMNNYNQSPYGIVVNTYRDATSLVGGFNARPNIAVNNIYGEVMYRDAAVTPGTTYTYKVSINPSGSTSPNVTLKYRAIRIEPCQ